MKRLKAMRWMLTSLLLGLGCVSSLGGEGEATIEQPLPAAAYRDIAPLTVEEANAAVERLRAFLREQMTDAETGAIYVNAVNDRPVVAGEARNHDALSETVGQMLEWAKMENQTEIFAQQMRLVGEVFQGSGSPFLAWKVTLAPLQRADTSATLDDWRIVWAAAEGGRRWEQPAWTEKARDIAAALVEKTAPHMLPPPAFNLSDGSPGQGVVLLCYLHLPAMQTAVNLVPPEQQPRALELLDRATSVLAQLPCSGGIIPPSYDPVATTYVEGVSDEVLALLTLEHARAAGAQWPWMQQMLDFRRQWFREQGWLPQAFVYPEGRALPEKAGAAVYARYARILLASDLPGAYEEAAKALRLMLSFQNLPGQPFAGAIGGYPVFSFDQLEALLALTEFVQKSP